MPSTPPRAIVQAEDAGLGRGADRDAADVLKQDGHAALGRQGDVVDVGDATGSGHPADHHRLLAAADERAAGVAIVRFDRLRDLRDGQLVLLERERIDLDWYCLTEPAEGDDVRHAVHLREPRRDDPVLELAQLPSRRGRRLRGRSDRTR